MGLCSLKLLQKGRAGSGLPARPARNPARTPAARHCHLVGAVRPGAGRRAPSAGCSRRGGRATAGSPARPAPAGTRRRAGAAGARGGGAGGGARRRRSRGLATGSSQWEHESGGACVRRRRRGQAGVEASVPPGLIWAGKRLPRRVRLSGGEPLAVEGAGETLKIAESFKIGLSHS